MNTAIYFKWLQRKNRFRNPECITHISECFDFSRISNLEQIEIQRYLEYLHKNEISFTYPSHFNYPLAFYLMKDIFKIVRESFSTELATDGDVWRITQSPKRDRRQQLCG